MDRSTFIFCERFGVFAIGVARASQKMSMSPPLDHHVLPALFAHHIRRFFLPFEAFHFIFGLVKVLSKGFIEFFDRGHPVLFAFFNFVQFGFHPCGEGHIKDLREVINKSLVHKPAKLRGGKPTLGLFHIPPVLYRGNNGGIG